MGSPANGEREISDEKEAVGEPAHEDDDEGTVPIRWRTVTGKSGKAKLRGEQLRLLANPDSIEMLNFLGLEEADEAVNNLDEEPEFIYIEVCLDSGAGDHVLSRVDVPGFTIEESPASRAGRGFIAANNKKIPNEGQTTVRIKGKDGIALRSLFQVAEVSRPLWSVGKLCDQGFDTKFNKHRAVITDETGKEVLVFERKNGVYLCMLQVRNPKLKPKESPDFARPSRR